MNKLTTLSVALITSLLSACQLNISGPNSADSSTANPSSANKPASTGMATEKAIQATMAPPLTGPNIVPKQFIASAEQRQQLAERKQAVQFFNGLFLRDPYIMLGPDDYYYYTGTRLDRIEGGDPNNHLTEGVEIWRSKDLLDWQLLGVPFRFANLSWKDELSERGKALGRKPMMWAPELHYINNKWVITHTTSVKRANLLIADNPMGPYAEPYPGSSFGHRHDPTFFVDDDNSVYLLSKAYEVTPMQPSLDQFAGPSFRVDPANRKIGHEGLSMVKIFDKYVIFGTGWSTDKMRHGSYNMYYATADNLQGPYSDRKFLGRFLGHGTPFKDKQGNWWVTAFKNGNVYSHEQIKHLTNQADKAITPMSSGFMLVPIEPKLDTKGDVYFDVLDERYKYPGPEEVQQF
ncbi:beta-xylosidase [Saccharobesus litoralis]|uniref:Beta-xylosidase n=1 Tax=Saccharobesus litoralis TaxID=2172099 RepID=A0A2S0VQ33_9ALTE|nr:family 43 glycosylhydrolase [Saccharobesus litoralis]AWB66327.1 beta-xylosidase [Saccharobesus litoralis]